MTREEALRGGPLLGRDDLLACVLGGVYTEVDQTMIESQRSTIVRETRSVALREAMQQKFIDTVELLTGRRVRAFISNQHVVPDLEVELFVLAPSGSCVRRQAGDGGFDSACVHVADELAFADTGRFHEVDPTSGLRSEGLVRSSPEIEHI
jgi:uncharacterized protein YbcI